MSSSVERFRTADSTAMSAPLSEPAQNIRIHEKDAEKEEERRVEDVSVVDTIVVHQEDEKFEWREVIRGQCELMLASPYSHSHVLLDRPGGCSDMAYGHCISRHDSRLILVLPILVRV